MRFIFFIATILCLCGTARAEVEFVELPGDDKPVQAALYRPAGNGPFPVVVAMHGCEGLKGKSGAIRPLLDEWGKRLAAGGFLVLLPDSYSSRGLSSQCREKTIKIRPDRERVTDIRAARDWLQQQDFVRADRIALLGWDNGAIAVLWAIRPSFEPDDERPDFRSAAVLYPGCRRLNETAWSTRVPTLVLIGALDDWTPAKNCEQMVAGARGRSARAVIVKYKGAHHAFDRDNLPLRQLRGVAFSSNDAGRVTLGTNADARADVIKRVPEWFSR